VFASVPLEGIPEPPVTISFIRVELPPGSQTSIHTHPGSEFIYETEGDIDY
jgi:quercetin dioxygenase-like cupin family protein